MDGPQTAFCSSVCLGTKCLKVDCMRKGSAALYARPVIRQEVIARRPRRGCSGSEGQPACPCGSWPQGWRPFCGLALSAPSVGSPQQLGAAAIQLSRGSEKASHIPRTKNPQMETAITDFSSNIFSSVRYRSGRSAAPRFYLHPRPLQSLDSSCQG